MDGGIPPWTSPTTTFYEQGYNTSDPLSGLPLPGTPFVSNQDPNHVFELAPDYVDNDALLLDGTNSAHAATLGLRTPLRYSALSLLIDSGSGSTTFTAVVHHANNSSETFSGLTAYDWYDHSPAAYTSDGRVGLDGTFDSIDSGDPRLYQLDISLADTRDPVTSIDFYDTGGAGHGVVWGVSGIVAPVPEPASWLLMGLGAVLLCFAGARRRRACAMA